MSTRRFVVVFCGVFAAAIAVALTATFGFGTGPAEEESELPFPPYWHEIKEGETTRAELVDRLGKPTRIDGQCLYYERLVETQSYRFCFTGDTLALKAAY